MGGHSQAEWSGSLALRAPSPHGCVCERAWNPRRCRPPSPSLLVIWKLKGGAPWAVWGGPAPRLSGGSVGGGAVWGGAGTGAALRALHGRASAALRFRCGGGCTERSAAIPLGVALLALLLSASSVNASHGTVSVSTYLMMVRWCYTSDPIPGNLFHVLIVLSYSCGTPGMELDKTGVNLAVL